MASRGELLERLKKLNSAQFEEVLFLLKINPAIIPSPFAEQSTRAIRVIYLLEQEQEGLERLKRTLAEPAISIIGEQYIGYEIEAQVKRILNEYTKQPFEGREEDKRKIDEFVNNNSSGMFLVTAAAGFGKSALLSHWQQTRQEDCFIAYHCFSYRYEKTRSVLEAYRHLLKQLYLYYNIRNEQFPNDENGMREILIGMLCEPVSQEGKRLVIVLDGLDEAEKTFEPFFTELPAGVFVIASARAEEGDEPEYLRNWTDNAQRRCLKRLPREAIAKWLEQISELAAYSEDHEFVKSLDDTTGGFPLYLRFLIDELKEAATKNQDVQAVVRNSPRGFKAYVEEQFRQLAKVKEIKQQQEVRELFALLSVALGALSQDDIQDVTNLSTFDLVDLPWQARRWFSIQTRFYSFAHPLLADKFQGVLGRQADSAQGKLIDYCAKWQEHHSAYALRYYAEHLGKAKRWEELYELALNEEFVTTQRQHLPNQPDLPLKTVQLALERAAERDDVGGMAEFLLVHAQRLMQIAQASPLDMLRLGNITGALALAETFDLASCILWYLLLAWKLATDANQDRGKITQAREILERLQQKDLPRLSELWMEDCAVYLLTPLLAATNGTFTHLSKRVLDDRSLTNLCQNLVEGSDFTTALETARQIDSSLYRAEALREIAKAQAQAENFAAALTTAQQIDDSYYRARALIAIAKAQPTAENFTAALDTARQIDDSNYRAEALREIAKAQAQAENFTAALDTAQQIDSSFYRAWALRDIAKAQAQAENFAAALTTAQQIDYSYYRAEALREIAKAQVEAKLSKQALLTAEKIIIYRNKHLPNIAAAFVETGDKENFKQLLIPCAYYLNAAYQMCGHLAKLYPNQVTAVAVVVSNTNKVKD